MTREPDHIVSNQIKCLGCGDSIYSAHRHDFVRCKCGKVAVDGGQDYMRRVGGPWEDESILIEDDAMQQMTRIVAHAIKTRRNPYGVAIAALRAIRDINLRQHINDFQVWQVAEEENDTAEEDIKRDTLKQRLNLLTGKFGHDIGVEARKHIEALEEQVWELSQEIQDCIDAQPPT